jgi:ribonuclease-3
VAANLLELEKKLDYQFKDRHLLTLALSHRSFSRLNNERLEFLGDAVLDLVVTDVLYNEFPNLREGQLSPMRSFVVCKDSLGTIANNLELGPYLLLGSGEMKSGGHRRDSILGDTVEALIGAVYLDRGIDFARERIVKWFAPQFDKAQEITERKDSKTMLQEWLQRRGKALPNYQLINTGGEPHSRSFTVSCKIDVVEDLMTATASTLRKAEQLVAGLLLDELERSHDKS